MYLLDFYEQGIHERPYVGSHAPSSAKMYARLKMRGFDLVSDQTLNAVFAKINDIAVVDPVLAAFIEKALFTIHWNFSNDEILSTDDTQTCVFKIKIHQLALRQGNLVNISLSQFNHMDPLNQAGLIIHEALQSLSPEKPRDICHHRRQVALLFTKSFLRGSKNFWNQVFRSYPTGFEALKLYPKIGTLATANGYLYSRKAMGTFWEKPIGDTKDNLDILDWILFPSVDIYFKDGYIILDENVLSAPAEKELCQTANPFNVFYLKYWDVSLTPRYNEIGESVPRFDWALKESVFYNWNKNRPLQPCDSDDRQFLKSFDAWRKAALQFQIN